MKKSRVIWIVVFLLVSGMVFVATTALYKNKIDKQEFKVYSFEGEDKNLRISNGLVIIAPDKQVVNGGKIQYLGNRLENIQSYSETIYLAKPGGNDTILTNSLSLPGNSKGTEFPDVFSLNKSTGEISSEKLFSKDDMNLIKNNLYFSLDYSSVDGQKGNFTIKLNVKEFDMKETK